MEASGFSTNDGRAWRRLQALSLKQQGWYQRAIAEALGVSEVSVSHWLGRVREGGPEALLGRPASGHPPKLSAAQKDLIPEFLWHGPEAYGFRGAVWTCARIAAVIAEEFGVRYHKDHVSRLLKGTALDAPSADPAGHPARRASDSLLARPRLAGVAPAGWARAPCAGFRG